MSIFLSRRNLLIVFVLFLGSCGVIYSLISWRDAATEINEASFKTNAEKILFLERILKIDIPDSAHDIHFEYVSWLDWKLEGVFALPKQDWDSFQAQHVDPTHPETVSMLKFSDEKVYFRAHNKLPTP